MSRQFRSCPCRPRVGILLRLGTDVGQDDDEVLAHTEGIPQIVRAITAATHRLNGLEHRPIRPLGLSGPTRGVAPKQAPARRPLCDTQRLLPRRTDAPKERLHTGALDGPIGVAIQTQDVSDQQFFRYGERLAVGQ